MAKKPALSPEQETANWHGAEALRPMLTPVASLLTDPRNARSHNDRSYDAIAASLRQFGQRKPIVVDADGKVIAGNGTLEAARRLGWTHLATVDTAGLSPEQVRAFALADNRTAELSGWNEEVLSAEILEVKATLLDVELGWSAKEIKEITTIKPQHREDDAGGVPDVKADPVSKVGEVYELGPHRLLCGDSTNPKSAAIVVDGAVIECLWTDPPYGVSLVGGGRQYSDDERRARGGMEIIGDKMNHDELSAMLVASVGNAAFSVMRDGGAVYVAGPSVPIGQLVFAKTLMDLGCFRSQLIWRKDAFVLGRGDYHYQHEPIFYGWKPGAAHYFASRDQGSVLDVPRPRVNKEHPTMKPVALVERCLTNSTKAGDHVLDLFGGSGTTLIACAQLGRIAHLIELDPRFADVIRRRWTRWARAAGVDPGSGALD